MTAKQKRRKRPARQTVEPTEVPRAESIGLFANATLGWSLFSAVAVWLAFAPVGWWVLAWIAPFGWLRVINMPELPGKRPYQKIAIAAYVHWLVMIHWVALPCIPAAVGMFFLAAYLAIYLVGFIALSRWLVHRAGWSSVIAAPVAWVALEALRSYLFTGFALCSLSHSQVDFVPVMQIAKYTGAYGVSFVVMFVAAAFERSFFRGSNDVEPRRAARWIPLIVSVLVMAAVVGFGVLSTRSDTTTNVGEIAGAARVAIVQGSLDTEFGSEKAKLERQNTAFQQYLYESEKVTRSQRIDLVVWPESMFRYDEISYAEEIAGEKLVPDFYTFRDWSELNAANRKKWVLDFRTKCLLGTGTEHYRKDGVDRYNTAGFYDTSGEQVDAYHKMHPVMFGEYIPLGDVLPWLYSFTPLPGGLMRGKEAKSFDAAGVAFVPNICFENTVPHLIRKQIRTLHDRGERVDVLVTLTNDGWFWGSALLDLHLACGIYRSVENGLPMLIAANTGFSAHIDRHGRVLQKGPRRASKVLVAEVQALLPQQARQTFYTRFGDVFAGANLLLACVGVAIGRRRPTEPDAEADAAKRSAQETQ